MMAKIRQQQLVKMVFRIQKVLGKKNAAVLSIASMNLGKMDSKQFNFFLSEAH